jgi:hypothetical protein
MLRLNICDCVTSCCWQKEPTAASIVLGSLKPVVGSDSLNVFLLAINDGRYDLFLITALWLGVWDIVRRACQNGFCTSLRTSERDRPPVRSGIRVHIET